MSGWSRIENDLPENPKLASLDVRTRWLYLEVLLYCGRHLTDGHISAEVLRQLDARCDSLELDTLGRRNPGANGYANGTLRGTALLTAGLLEIDGAGYVVHDYLKHQRSRAEVLAEREEGRLRAKRSRERRANGQYVHPNASPRSPDTVRHGIKDKGLSRVRANGNSNPSPESTPQRLDVAKLRELAQQQAANHSPLDEPKPATEQPEQQGGALPW